MMQPARRQAEPYQLILPFSADAREAALLPEFSRRPSRDSDGIDLRMKRYRTITGSRRQQKRLTCWRWLSFRPHDEQRSAQLAFIFDKEAPKPVHHFPEWACGPPPFF